MQAGSIRTALLVTHEALQGGYDSEFFGRGSLDTFHRTVQEEWEARGKGLAEFRRHEHVPFVLFVVAKSDNEKVFLEDVRGLALLAHHIGIVASSYKLVEDLEFGLAESAENFNGVVHDLQSDSATGLVFPKIRADVQVKLLADLKHFHLRSGVYDLLQHYLGRLEVFIGNSNHFVT